MQPGAAVITGARYWRPHSHGGVDPFSLVHTPAALLSAVELSPSVSSSHKPLKALERVTLKYDELSAKIDGF